MLAVDATFEELRDVAGPGRYRRYPLDASGRVDVLSPTERDEAQRVLEFLTFQQQTAWLVELECLSLPDAIA